MEVSNRLIVFSKGRLEQIGSPAEVYEDPATEFVARFIGSMNIVEAEVKQGIAHVAGLEFPAPGVADGQRVRIGFRPYYIKLSEDPNHFRQQARLRHVYFLGVAYRLEIETDSGLILRSRMNKEEFRQRRFEVGQPVSYAITHFRILPQDYSPLMSTPRITDNPLTP
jgi:sulfate/thiosulfate transport system ATP-binding protein